MREPKRGGPIASLAAALSILFAACPAPPEAGPSVAVIEPGEPLDSIVRKAANVVPTGRQLAWQELEFIAFAHFGMNTFTDREWGQGTEDPALFNPTAFDARQWVRVLKDAGMKQLIITAKHHDGFCLWPTAQTDHCVRSSPWRGGTGDVVGDLAAACRESGLKFGVYLSPWDRHEPSYGDSSRYNEFFRRQLRELLTNYGEVTEVWFDGACGEGPNGKRQVYDWPSYYAVIRELQPEAVIFGMAPDLRWVGTESGYGRETEWSVIPAAPPVVDPARIRKGPYPLDEAFLPRDFTGPDLGSRAKLEGAAALFWYPAETDVSIRPGWFHHPAEDGAVKTPATLVDIYFSSVGRNGVLLLNVPPDRRGLIHESDVAGLRGMRAILDGTFGTDFADGAEAAASSEAAGHRAASILDGRRETYWRAADGVESASIELELKTEAAFDVVLLAERIAAGQRVELFRLESRAGGAWQAFARGTTIGHKRLLRFPAVLTKAVRLVIEASRTSPTLAAFGLYKMKEGA
jgi:alpha-L-fucosidase